MCASGYDGDACETPMYSEIFMDGELPMLGEGEAGWVNGPDWNNAGSITPVMVKLLHPKVILILVIILLISNLKVEK